MTVSPKAELAIPDNPAAIEAAETRAPWCGMLWLSPQQRVAATTVTGWSASPFHLATGSWVETERDQGPLAWFGQNSLRGHRRGGRMGLSGSWARTSRWTRYMEERLLLTKASWDEGLWKGQASP